MLLLVDVAWASTEGEAQSEERILHIGQPLAPSGVNFLLLETGIWNTVIYHDLNELLVRFNQVGDRFEPGQAETWRYDENKGEYWFTLRRGLKWSDGTPIVAQDYVRSWRYYASNEDAFLCDNVLKSVKNFEDIKAKQLPAERLGIQAEDDVTLRVTLAKPSKSFLRFLTYSDCFLLPFHRRDQLDFSREWTNSEAAVYNGPYRLQSDIEPGKPVVLDRNPHYWNKEKIYFDKIVWHAYAQRNTELVKDLLQGRLHIAYYMNGNPNVPWMLDYRPDWIKHQPSGFLEFLTIQKSRPPLAQSSKLRQALSMSIDRKALVRGLPNRQQGTVAFSLAPQHYYQQALPEPEWWQWSMQERREKARGLLTEAGYGPSNPLSISLRMNEEQERARVAESIAAMWQAVGVETKLNLGNITEHYHNIDRGDFEIARAGWLDATGSPRYFFRLLDPNGTTRPQSLKLPDWPEALSDPALTEEQQEQLYHKVEALNQSTASIIPLYHLANLAFVNPKLQGYSGGAWWLRDLQALRWRDETAPAP